MFTIKDTPTRAEVQDWLREARKVNLKDPEFQRGILMLEQLIVALTPKKTMLLPNYPNPFKSETRIPFELEDALFEEGKPVMVSIRIYNILSQFVAAPLALGHRGGEGLPLLQLEYTAPGRYEAHWDGRDRHGKQVASGVYFVQLRVDQRGPAVRRMFVTK